jgi:hypothetical protein
MVAGPPTTSLAFALTEQAYIQHTCIITPYFFVYCVTQQLSSFPQGSVATFLTNMFLVEPTVTRQLAA